MSHFTRIQTKMIDEQAAMAALEELGCTIEVHKVAKQLNNDYSAARAQNMKAHIIVRQSGTDFGLLRTEQGLEIVTDPYFIEARSLAQKLPAAYAKQVVIRKAQELGDEFTVAERTENGVFAGYTIIVEKAVELLAGSSMVSSHLSIGN